MRKHQRFLIPWSVLLLFIGAFSSSSAQENLPAIVKRIKPSAVIILTYDKEGKALGQGSGFFYSSERLFRLPHQFLRVPAVVRWSIG